MLDNITKAWTERDKIFNAKEAIEAAANKYNTPEYFQDPMFREIYKEAYKALGANLDADKFVSLIENYVTSRIYALEKTSPRRMKLKKQ